MERPRPTHLRLVSAGERPARQRPAPRPAIPVQTKPESPRVGPLKPRRPAAAVRKSLRAALARCSALEAEVLACDSRRPTSRALLAIKRLQAHTTRMAALTAELDTAVRREINGQRWLRGQLPYGD